MRLSTKARYGLRACYCLAQKYNNIINLSELSSSSGVTPKYLERLLGLLIKNDIVKSERGPAGGYALSKPPAQISIGEVFRALEDGLRITDCQSGCPDMGCPNRNILAKLQTSINQVLDSYSLKDLVDDNIT